MQHSNHCYRVCSTQHGAKKQRLGPRPAIWEEVAPTDGYQDEGHNNTGPGQDHDLQVAPNSAMHVGFMFLVAYGLAS
jgi:hypothetical protein